MLPTGFSLRHATEADLPSIVEIYNSIIPGRMVTADLEPVTVEQRKPWLAAHNLQTRPVWVLIDELSGSCIGWMSFDTFYTRAAYDGTVMLAIYLSENHRGKGLGRALLDEAVRIAPAHQVHTLLGYIFGHNAPSLALFAKAGFERWGHLPRVAVLDGIERDLIIVGRRLV